MRSGSGSRRWIVRDPALTELKSSGYIRVERGPLVAILDVGPVGPDYLPGHAHADTLSFELSVGRQRVLVNSGTSTYEPGAERNRQRGPPRTTPSPWATWIPRKSGRAFASPGGPILGISSIRRLGNRSLSSVHMTATAGCRESLCIAGSGNSATAPSPSRIVSSERPARAVARFHFHPASGLSPTAEQVWRGMRSRAF